MTSSPQNIGASVRARLLGLAREQGDDFQLILIRYANERLLYRVAQSPYSRRFVLKGATLFTIWTGEPHRGTRDIDLLGFGDPNLVHGIFAEVLATVVIDDGLVFDLLLLARRFEFEGQLLVQAIRATFDRRGTLLSTGIPTALTPEFAEDPLKQTQWTAFLRRSGVKDTGTLPATMRAVSAFVERPLSAAANDAVFTAHWQPGGPWS